MTAARARIHVTPDVVADVSPYLFGALTEHFGRGLYGGLWDAERDVPRADVKAAAAGLGATMFRYPGGCFADWYHWRDGVGPRDQRPTHDATYWTGFRFDEHVPARDRDRFVLPDRITHAFGPRETNQVGTDEFLRYCVDLDVEPMLVANFGSGTPAEAAAWVAHTNRDGAPRPVRWWGVGNETYGPWEIGHRSASDYATGYRRYVEAMRAVDPAIRTVAVGWGAPSDAGREWNRTIARDAGDLVDALSVHWYFPGPWLGRGPRDDESDYRQIALGADDLGEMLDDVVAAIDPHTQRPLALALDEWNLWFTHHDLLATNHRQCDGVFFAGAFNRMIERADRVRIAAISHLVNCMAPIQTRGDRHFVTTAYLVMQMYRRLVRRDAVRVRVECDQLDAAPFADTAQLPDQVQLAEAHAGGRRSGAALDAAATADPCGTTVFLANRLVDHAQQVRVGGLAPGASGRLRMVVADSPWSRNDVDDPSAVAFRDIAVCAASDGTLDIEIPPHTAGAISVQVP